MALKQVNIVGLEKERSILELAVKKGYPSLLVGETGLGKTQLLYSMAQDADKRLHRVSLNGEIGINELLGKWTIKDKNTYWMDGILIKAMKEGSWIVLDELNAALPEVLFCLNSLLDKGGSILLAEKDGEVVSPHEDFRLFATMNPPDEYAGTKEMNKALLSRFPIIVHFEQYAPKTERDIIVSESGVDENSASVMVDVATIIRQKKMKDKIMFSCSTRDLVNWACVYHANGHTLWETYKFSIMHRAHTSEYDILKKCFTDVCTKAKVDENVQQKDMKKMLTEEFQKGLDDLRRERKRLKKMLKDMKKSYDKLSAEVDNDS